MSIDIEHLLSDEATNRKTVSSWPISKDQEGLRALDPGLRCPGCGQSHWHHLRRKGQVTAATQREKNVAMAGLWLPKVGIFEMFLEILEGSTSETTQVAT